MNNRKTILNLLNKNLNLLNKKLKFLSKFTVKSQNNLIVNRISKMLRTIVVFAPIIAALAWVTFNIQKPAREQFNRDFLGKD